MNQPTVAPDTLWTLKYPELGTAPIPVEPCISTDYFDLERERIFKRVWLNVGRVEEVPAPGRLPRAGHSRLRCLGAMGAPERRGHPRLS